MTFRKILVCALAPCALIAAPPGRAADGRLPPRLVALARQSEHRRGWEPLLRYAQSRIPRHDRGWALFVLGYREYSASKYPQAEERLASASATGFELADLAVYYEASAWYEDGKPERTIELLRDFSHRYPKSTASEDASELLAWAYLQTREPGRAIEVLTAIPEVNERPKLALLLGRAYQEAERPVDAANAYQNVYYSFPGTSQARAADMALTDLKAMLGGKFPGVPDQIASARASKLLASGNHRIALDEYNELLKDRRQSALAWSWNLGRAKCLLQLGRADEVVETLAGATPVSPAVDAERLGILVEAYLQKKDEDSSNRVLKELQASYPKSLHYARALMAIANYFFWKPDLGTAATLYDTLEKEFPGTSEGATASWRGAWSEYVQGKAEAAQEDLLGLIKNYPTSARIPAALYFLGRLAEAAGQKAEAREYLVLLRSHYLHDYYAIEAARRLRGLGQRNVAHRNHATSEGKSKVEEIASVLPARDPISFNPCAPGVNDERLAPSFKLAALGLEDLALQSAANMTGHGQDSPEFILDLSRLDADAGRTDLAIHRVKQISPDYDRYEFDELPEEMWLLLYPRNYWSAVHTRAEANRLDPYLVMALIRQESGFNPRANSPSDARGLMQVLPATASGSHFRSAVQRLYEPYFNIRFGCAYLRELLKRYNGNRVAALAAYNAGPTRVDGWLAKYPKQTPEEFIESIPFPGTRVYVKAVLRDQVLYRSMLTGSVKYRSCRARTRPRRGRKKR